MGPHQSSCDMFIFAIQEKPPKENLKKCLRVHVGPRWPDVKCDRTSSH